MIDSIDWNYFAHQYRFSVRRHERDHWQPSAQRRFRLQRATEAVTWLFTLLTADAVRLSGPDPNKFVEFLSAPVLPARQTCSSDSAANVQRPRAGAHANSYVKQPLDSNTYVNVFQAKIATKYMQIHAYTEQYTFNTAFQYMILIYQYDVRY
jgi:hypothetical protein